MTAHDTPNAGPLDAAQMVAQINEMIRLRPSRSPAISQMANWRDTIAALQQQLDEARAERDKARLHMSAWEDSARINKARAEAAELALSARDASQAQAVVEWRYEIQHGPDGEANYAWVYRGKEMICTTKTHHAIAIVSALTRPSTTEAKP